MFPSRPSHSPAVRAASATQGSSASAGSHDASGDADAPDALPPHLGDEAPPGTPGTGEGLCRACGGSGRTDDGQSCPQCDGTGKVTVGIGGA